MSNDVTSGPPLSIETVDTVKAMAEIMSQHELSEIDIETDAGRIRMRRGPRVVSQHLPFPSQIGSAAAGSSFGATPIGMSATAGAAAAPVSNAAPEPGKMLLEIKSETLGTFYSKPNPEAEPYVKVGSRVTEKTVVGLIEAMKIFNEVLAGVSGVITEVLVENQQPVEYGTVLFRVDPS
ncbi:MAG: acetyl-CoA carboxylase, biotin carboxyl carrier protein [Gemmataceae bacterium]|nr:acetyl-CoA carboxylase, biotin carboxyl carrier protein [Gemmataceae bacterium]